MDPRNDLFLNPYQYADPKLEDMLSKRKRKRSQTLAKGPFSKSSGYLPPTYYHRQQKFLARGDSRCKNDGLVEDEKFAITREFSKDGFEERDKHMGQEAEVDSEVEKKKMREDTSDEGVPCRLMIDQDSEPEVRDRQEDVSVNESSEEASAQETKE